MDFNFTRRAAIQWTGAAFAFPTITSNNLESGRMAFTPKFVDLVRNVATVSGTGPVTIGAAVNGYSSLAGAVAAGEQFYYSIQGIDKPAEREIGRGTMQPDGKVAREAIAGALTSFSGGTKTIALVAAAEWFATLDQLAGGAAAGVASRAELAAKQGGSAVLKEGGRAGLFAYDPSNLSAKVAADSAQGLYVAPTSDPTGGSGAWVRTFEGPVNPMWFGVVAGNAAGANGPSNSAALSAMFTALRARSNTQSSRYRGHEWVRFPVGYFEFASTIEITEGTFSIEGASTGGPTGHGTELKFPAGVTGIRTQFENSSGATGGVVATHYTGHGSTVRNLALKGGFTTTEAEAHGIQLRARANIENVYIAQFEGDGIHGHANIDDPTYHGNTNLSFILNCRIQECRNGIYVDGADANIWSVIAVDVSSNRRWGVLDSSFLGNSYFGMHAASNGAVSGPYTPNTVTHNGNRYGVIAGQEAGASTNAPSGTSADNGWWYFQEAGGASSSKNISAWASGTAYRSGGSYHSNNANARNVFIGCYHEGGQGDAQLCTPTLVLGGMMAHSVMGTAGVLDTVQGAIQTNRAFEASVVTAGGSTFTARLGESDPTISTALYIKDSVAFPSTARLRVSGNDILFDYANSSSARAFRITGPNTTEQFGTGAAQPHSFYPPHLVVGDAGENAGNARRVAMDVAAPTTGAHAQGEVVFNRAASAGGPMGWMCVAAGTPGTWKAMANLAT